MTHDEAERLARDLLPNTAYHDAASLPIEAGDLRALCDHILSGDMKREIENAALYLPADKINDLQLASIKRLVEKLKWSHHADITVRRDGQDHHFEADWLKHLIQPPAQKEDGK